MQLKKHYPKLPFDNVIITDVDRTFDKEPEPKHENKPIDYTVVSDPYEIDFSASLLRKIYWFYKFKIRHYLIFRKIENYRKQLGIQVFLGVFSGVLPLVFHLGKKSRKAAVIFSDMDSWFSEIHSDMKKYWYRKYCSFNYALENSDFVDFLSPFIHKGVELLGVKVPRENVSIADSSFSDYSKCKVGEKKQIEIVLCARLEPHKNPLLYLSAAKAVLEKYPDVKFHILGEGSLTKEVEYFLSSNGLTGEINFEYRINPTEVFAESSIFVSMQSTNNYPSQSVLEAMACGNAIIASDVGDTRLFINEENGILIPLNLKSLIAAIEQLILNPDKTRQLGSKAREFVMKNHTIDKSSRYYLALIQKAYTKVFGN
jgi:glycosyltransferase involved in cell wall biosynthesis